MKIKFILLLIFSYFSSLSQEVKMPKDELTKLLCKNWMVDSIVMNAEKITLGKSIEDSGLEFKTDNTFVEKPYIENPKKCFWKYNEQKQNVELFEDGKLIGTIKSINHELLIFLPFLNEEAKKFIKSSEMYLKPKN